MHVIYLNMLDQAEQNLVRSLCDRNIAVHFRFQCETLSINMTAYVKDLSKTVYCSKNH